ncbi:hypothetical protein rosag_51010 [Roseisolibacter agri]|uniref:Transposase InsH N-terminal domain-containing protein n=1 Tax=Roseisolibacter agri TaxID=2014610 RepID=A0AA37VD84_9BACT|nr:hypothetical protein rosag_51010 [Roseisolibacter agri]
MRAMTKSAVALATEALTIGRMALPPYSCPTSRHDYTQPQLFALLVLKQMLRLDYRGVVTLVAEWTELRRALGLRRVPDHSTLCYAAHRLLAGAEKGGPSSGRSRPSSSAPRSRASSLGAAPPRRSTPVGSRRTTSAPTTATATRRATAPRTPASMAVAPPKGGTVGPRTRS